MNDKPTTLTLFFMWALWTARSLSDFLTSNEDTFKFGITVWITGIVGLMVLIAISYKIEKRKEWIEKGNPRIGSIVLEIVQMALAVYFLLGLIDYIKEGFSSAYIGLPAILFLVVRDIVKVWNSTNIPIIRLQNK